MKKFLSMALAMLLVFSVLSPVTVFAENGPFPFDPEDKDINLSELSILSITDMETYEIGVFYPQAEGVFDTTKYPGASYDLETNTLTLNNVKSKTSILSALDMGDDFKIKLIGYNELGGISSETSTRGASITITGNGELVLNRADAGLGIYIDAAGTASKLNIEETVKLKVYSTSGLGIPTIYVSGSSITDSAELIKLGGAVVSDKPGFEKYTVDIYEQIEAYDLEWNCYDWYEVGLVKDGVYYIADEEYDETTFEGTGKYLVSPVAYDEILGCYTLGEATVVKNFDGFTVLTKDFEPMYDEALGFYIGYTDYPDEPNDSYKYIFDPDEKDPFNLCIDANGTQYGFWQYEYEDVDEGTTGVDTYVYKLIEHPAYGFIAIQDQSINTLDGFTPLKIDEKELADAYYSSVVVINNGGAIKEPGKIKNITATSTNQGVKITWSANSVADKYRIYRKADGEKKWTRLDTVGADETSFIDKNVKSGKKYTYTVKGANFVGEGKFNSTGVAHTYYEAPDVTIKTTTKGVYLKWAKVAGATKYRIYRQTSGSSKWTLIDTVKGTSFTDKTAKSGKKYYYRVRAAKGDIMSGYNVVSKYFLSSPKLSSVKNSASGVKVAWEKVNGAEGYKIYRKSGSGSYDYIGKTTKTTYTDKTAKSGTTYTYTVKAYKSKTDSSYNKTGLKLKYLEAPKISTKEYSKSIKLSWNEINGAKEYAVYRKADGESKWTKLTTTEGLTYKDTSVKNNKTYQYRVRAVNGSTLSSYRTKVVTK